MRLRDTQPFDATAPLVARRDFTFNGVKFAAGEPFPGNSGVVCSDRRLRQMWDNRSVMLNPDDPERNNEQHRLPLAQRQPNRKQRKQQKQQKTS